MICITPYVMIDDGILHTWLSTEIAEIITFPSPCNIQTLRGKFWRNYTTTTFRNMVVTKTIHAH